MQGNENNSFSLDEAITEIASILARGYMSQRMVHRIAPDSEAHAARLEIVEESELLTEKRLDCSDHRSPHAFAG